MRARSSARRASLSSASASGSPPDSRISSIVVVGRQVVERPLPVGTLLGVGEVAAEAVAAMDRAGSGDHQQGAAAVFVEEARNRGGRHLRQRIARIPGRRRRHFGGQRQHLEEQADRAGSPRRIRRTKACGTRSGKSRAAARASAKGAGKSAGASSTRLSSSSTFATAAAISRCQAGISRPVPAARRAGRGERRSVRRGARGHCFRGRISGYHRATLSPGGIHFKPVPPPSAPMPAARGQAHTAGIDHPPTQSSPPAARPGRLLPVPVAWLRPGATLGRAARRAFSRKQ